LANRNLTPELQGASFPAFTDADRTGMHPSADAAVGMEAGPSGLTSHLRRLRRRLRTVTNRTTQPLYAVYERRLANQVSQRPPPRHIGIILDGNRRYAQREGIEPARDAYRLGAQKLDEVLQWCVDLGIPAITLWVLSSDNFGRSAEEVHGILDAVQGKMRMLAVHPYIHRHRVRVRAIGRIEMLPAAARNAIRLAEEATADYDGMLLSIAVAYGGREEIADAVRRMLAAALDEGKTLAETIGAVSPEAIARHLYLAGTPEPDLIIRTSGEVRLSGFLLWQSAVSEFYFSDVLWPAFRRIDFLRAIRSFQERTRRFGL
jgi:short-chain Z-isoprenyl diphosphate synthase